MQPGDTITPETPPDQSEDSGFEFKIPREGHSHASATPEQASELSEPSTVQQANNLSHSHSIAAPTPQPEPATEETPPDVSLPPRDAPEPEAVSWKYAQDSLALGNQAESSPISWAASEFVHHEKNNNWFMGLAAITVVVVIFTYIMTHDILTAVALIVASTLFGVMANRKPHTLQYQLTSTGVSVGDKFYPYSTLKAFSIVEADYFRSIQLVPFKRFAMPVVLYYPPEEEDRLINMIGSFLPLEKKSPDPVDRLMNKVRF